eukprot:gene10518-3222_t
MVNAHEVRIQRKMRFSYFNVKPRKRPPKTKKASVGCS